VKSGKQLKVKGKGALGPPRKRYGAGRPRASNWHTDAVDAVRLPNGGGISFKTDKEFGWGTGRPSQRGMHGLDDSDGDRRVDFSCFGGSGSGAFYQIPGALLRGGPGALDQRVQNAAMMARLVRPERKHGALPRLRGAGRAVAAIQLCGTTDTFSRSCRTALRDRRSPD
jgi:hypothetical protein